MFIVYRNTEDFQDHKANARQNWNLNLSLFSQCLRVTLKKAALSSVLSYFFSGVKKKELVVIKFSLFLPSN